MLDLDLFASSDTVADSEDQDCKGTGLDASASAPGDAPTNISIAQTKRVTGRRSPIGIVLKPAVRGVTD